MDTSQTYKTYYSSIYKNREFKTLQKVNNHTNILLNTQQSNTAAAEIRAMQINNFCQCFQQ